jgi:hypothetical protein
MRFFLCPFGDFVLGFPAEAAESLLVFGREASDTVEEDAETGDVYLSLPRYFRLIEQEVHHGIVLKDPNRVEDDRNRKIILVTTVEKIEDVPLEEIKIIPGILRGMQGSSFITGIKFYESSMTLFVDPTRLLLHTLDNEIISTLEEVEELEELEEEV